MDLLQQNSSSDTDISDSSSNNDEEERGVQRTRHCYDVFEPAPLNPIASNNNGVVQDNHERLMNTPHPSCDDGKCRNHKRRSIQPDSNRQGQQQLSATKIPLLCQCHRSLTSVLTREIQSRNDDSDEISPSSFQFIRSKRHVAGNWSGHVYCTIKLSKEQLNIANEAVFAYRQSIIVNNNNSSPAVEGPIVRHFCGTDCNVNTYVETTKNGSNCKRRKTTKAATSPSSSMGRKLHI
jgi:hypothetical protein